MLFSKIRTESYATLLFLGLLTYRTVIATLSGCEETADIDPCSCDTNTFRCEGIQDSQKLIHIANRIGNGHFRTIELESIVTEDLPSQIFKDISTDELSLKHCSFSHGLFDSSPSKKLREKLTGLNLESVNFSQGLDFEELHTFTALYFLHLRDVEIPSLGENFRRYVSPTLRFLEIERTKTHTIEPRSLSKQKNLLYLAITQTFIEQFSRDALPLYLPDLQILFLSKNRLTSLPDDAFEGMPKLETLFLSGNLFTTFNQRTFLPILNHLQHLLVDENPLLCNCNIWWLRLQANEDTKKQIFATCTDLRNNQVVDLKKLIWLDNTCSN